MTLPTVCLTMLTRKNEERQALDYHYRVLRVLQDFPSGISLAGGRGRGPTAVSVWVTTDEGPHCCSTLTGPRRPRATLVQLEAFTFVSTVIDRDRL